MRYVLAATLLTLGLAGCADDGGGCVRMCNALDACQPEPTDTTACVESCEDLSGDYNAAGCSAERDAFVQCIANEFERTCAGGCSDLAFEANECMRLATARE